MSTKELDIDSVTELFGKTKLISESGVSFANKTLKLDTEEDAKEVIDAILACKTLTYLNLEGNTLGIDAASGISKALEFHPEFKRALWKDLFTGRLKEEIPQALRHLGSGLMLSGAMLSELDLSDNAFGPIGVEGLAALLRSRSCYALQELKLNNNGLGITGGKLLARALMTCYEESKAENRQFALKVFIAGRNRLENEGAKALSEVFRVLQSLEEIKMPQNGIYHVGITALADAFQHNKNLRVIDLNDNTVSKKGSIALARVLPKLQSLSCLNLGDCLLKTSGAQSVAAALADGHENLEEINLSCNEITKVGGMAVIQALSNKKCLKTLILDGNQFGDAGVDEIKKKMASFTDGSVLSISEDEGSEDEEDEGEDKEEEQDETDDDDDDDDDGDREVLNENEGKENNVNGSNEVYNKETSSPGSIVTEQYHTVHVTADDFLTAPTPEKLLALGSSASSLIIEEIKQKQPEDNFLEALVSSLMKVSSLTVCESHNVQSAALSCSDELYEELFSWATSKDQLSLLNNSLLVHLGLLKSEDKKFKVAYNTDGCRIALLHAMTQSYFLDQSKDTVKVFLDRQIKKNVTTITL